MHFCVCVCEIETVHEVSLFYFALLLCGFMAEVFMIMRFLKNEIFVLTLYCTTEYSSKR